MCTQEKQLNLMTNDLKGPFSCLVESLEMLQLIEPENYLSVTLMLELKKYLDSEVPDDINWSEYRLSGQRCYSSNLRFQTDLVIQIIKYATKERLNVKNNIRDIKDMNLDLVLFGFILCKLLLLIERCCDGGDEIEINIATKNNHIVISITDNGMMLFKKLGQIFLNYKVEATNTKANNMLNSCYDILSFYGGNLWSESSEQSGLKLCFSMPVKKNP